MAVFQKGALVATAWMDNKMVTVMSTNCEAGKVSSTTRKLKNGQRQEFPCPEAIVSYSTHMIIMIKFASTIQYERSPENAIATYSGFYLN